MNNCKVVQTFALSCREDMVMVAFYARHNNLEINSNKFEVNLEKTEKLPKKDPECERKMN